MTMVCDRCGEVFPLSNDVKYMTPFDDELDQFESNSIVKCLAGDDKGIYSIRDETVSEIKLRRSDTWQHHQSVVVADHH